MNQAHGCIRTRCTDQLTTPCPRADQSVKTTTLTPLVTMISNPSPYISHPLEALGEPDLEHWLTFDSGHGSLPKNKSLLSLLLTLTQVLLGFDAFRPMDTFSLVTLHSLLRYAACWEEEKKTTAAQTVFMTEPWFPNLPISAFAFIEIILLCENIRNVVFVISNICVLLSFLQMPFWAFSTLLESFTLSLPSSGLRFSPGSQLKERLSRKPATHVCTAQGKSKLEAFHYSLHLPLSVYLALCHSTKSLFNKPRDTLSCVASS